MKKFKHLYKQIIENYTEGGSIFNGFNDMIPRTAYSDFGVHRIGEGDSVSRLNAFIHKFLGGTYIDPNGAIKELKTRLNMVGLDFDFDGSKVKLNPGQNVFPVKLYGDVFGQTPTTDLSKGFDHGDDLPMLKLMINCNYDEETCMWSMNGKLGIIREKKNELSEQRLDEIWAAAARLLGGAAARGAVGGAVRTGAAPIVGAATRGGAATVRTVARGPISAPGAPQIAGMGQLRRAVGSFSPSPSVSAFDAASRVGRFGPLRTVFGRPMRRPGAVGMGSASTTTTAATQPLTQAQKVAQLYGRLGQPAAKPSLGQRILTGVKSRVSSRVQAGKRTYASAVGFAKKNPLTALALYNQITTGNVFGMGGINGNESSGGGGYSPGAASAVSGGYAEPTRAGTMSTAGFGMNESKENLMEKSKLYKKIKNKIGEYGNKNKMCEYGCGSKDEMGEYGYDSEEGEEGSMSSPAPPNEHVVGYMDQMGGPISESVSKDKARSVMHAINRKGELHDKVLVPVFNNLLSKKLKGKLGTDDIKKQLFYVVNSATRKLKLVLSDKEKTRVVNDLIRNFRSFSKKKHGTMHKKEKETKKTK